MHSVNDFTTYYSPTFQNQKPVLIPYSPTNFSIKAKLHSEISKWNNRELPFQSEPSTLSRGASMTRLPNYSDMQRSPIPFHGPTVPKEQSQNFIQSYAGLRQQESSQKNIRKLKIKTEAPSLHDESTQASFMPSSIRRNGSLTVITSPKYHRNDSSDFVQSAMNHKNAATSLLNKSPSSVQLRPVHVKGKSKSNIPRGFSPITKPSPSHSSSKILIQEHAAMYSSFETNHGHVRRNIENITIEESQSQTMKVSLSVKNVNDFHAKREFLKTREGVNGNDSPTTMKKKPRVERLSLHEIKRKPSLELKAKFSRANSKDLERRDMTYLLKRRGNMYETEVSVKREEETMNGTIPKQRKIMTINPYQKLNIFNTLRYGDFGVEKSAVGGESLGESLKSSMKKGGGVKSKVMKTICKKVVTFGSNANSPTSASQKRGFETETF